VIGLVAKSLVWFAISAAAPGSAGTDTHLLAGARHFRDGRFDAALVEFRVAAKVGASGPARWYEGAALVKLGRHEEAIESFAGAAADHPASRDGLLDYYRAVALYELRLYLSADELLTGVEGGVGPRVAAQIRELRERIGRAATDEPERTTLAWYEERARVARAAGRSALADAYAREALALAARRRAPQGGAPARAELTPGTLPAEARRAR
jgi:tetratricopeptide (TPR) repeat protein